MDLTFNDLGCIHCHSKDVECCEWVDDAAGEEGKNWVFADGLGDMAGWNLEIAQDSRILFRCKKCGRFSVMSVNWREEAELLLPYQHRRKPHLSVTLLAHPATQEPEKLHIGAFAIDVVAIQQWRVKSSATLGHPFYPYPLGTYRLKCRWTGERESVDFDCEVERSYMPAMIVINEPDIDVHTFSITWTTERGFSVLAALRSRCGEDEIKSGAPSLTAIIAGGEYRPRPAWAAPIIDAAASARATQAYRFLYWLENRTRGFVWDLYKARYTPADENDNKWWKGCFPESVRNNIESAMRKAERLGGHVAGEPPLDYSEFDDLMVLLEKEWAFLAARVNTDREATRGHFQYLKHFRHNIAHSRRLSHDDLLKLQQRTAEWSNLLGARFLEGCPHPFYPPYSAWSA